ncbi:MAG: DUF72 domain-containing protein [Gemmataceae bacterium]
MLVHVGASGYAYKEWKGSFYPEKLPDKEMLRYYAERLGTVEINNTFYRMPATSVLENWASQVPADFRFVLKVSQKITHYQRLKGCAENVAYLLKQAATLGDRLGPLLFQLPPVFKKDIGRLRDFLVLLPRERQAAFEFRHESWFDDEVYAALREHDAALCIAEAEDKLNTPLVTTASWGYLRLRKPDYAEAELMAWAQRVKAQTWREAYVFFKHEDGGKAPALAATFLKLAI